MQGSWEPGRVILDKYRIERVLGRGGMGIVVAARHLHLDELFAIKVLSPQAVKRSTSVERFVREARAAARLKGEHVARVHDVGYLENDVPYMVMEYLEGQDLERELRSRGPLPIVEATLYVYQVCEGMLEAHAHGIVHRDLKPANLFLIRRINGAPSIKVLDFGISKMAEPAERKKDDLTETGALLGSPMYMSPEQILDGKISDVRTDIWAIGAIFYELLLGKPPFRAEQLTDLIRALTTSAPPSLHAARPDVPEDLEAIVLKCLEKHPRDRFQSISELMTALYPFVKQGFGGYVPSAPTMDLPGSSLQGQSEAELENGLAEQAPKSAPPAGGWSGTFSRGPLGSPKIRWIAGSAAIASMCLGGMAGLLWRSPAKSPGLANATEESSAAVIAAPSANTPENPLVAVSASPSALPSAEPVVNLAKPASKPAAPAPKSKKPRVGHESND